MAEFQARLEELRRRISAQSERVYDLLLRAVDVAFDLDPDRARELAREYAAIDREDV